MRTLFFSILLFATNLVLGQSESYAEALETFQANYNAKNPQLIFEQFDEEMQKAVDLEAATLLVTRFQKQYGDLKAIDFKENTGTREQYIGHFERGKINIFISLNDSEEINGLLFKPFEDDGSPGKITRNTTAFILPFKGTWFTVWGGDTKQQNYHVIDRAQRAAFDFLIIGKNGRSYERSGTRNEDYYAFGKPLYAVCDATAINVITGVEDNKPGSMNPAQLLGNSVTLKTDAGEYIVYAHFEKGTLNVKEGDRVKQGQYLGNCGNSGNSSEPHLHLHVQDGPDIYTATGVRCYFEAIMVNDTLKEDYSPVRLDRISRPE
ncbi:MAG: peptidoglycan DD-metalloendopeptidase family protein [Flavobacteriales bacterium]|jgi:murein DD-endopeptidase MepM/ murein hydrolase activator NlpD|uniref:peptidoglycan DD-metalloendopeptidase family protein n=1 Tax=Candidatus Ulvibacter alkanivorans TaxID=2267620 RepID=UPI000DF2A8AF|nr:peptidoglycan DD-metalloendopeptidase family protein [Candidatus Ulvibacter alkanivorans]MCH2488645.1 peptidoglycan DD-metalloendopeptidase family protein [Flavobacteriales bacterium]